MPACPWASPAQSTPRPDKSTQLLTQWRYGSWTAVRKQKAIRAHYSQAFTLYSPNKYTKAMQFLLNGKQVLALFGSSLWMCRLRENNLLTKKYENIEMLGRALL